MLNTKAKLWQVLHLSLAFTFYMYFLGDPFVTETLTLKKAEGYYSTLCASPHWDMSPSLTNHYQKLKTVTPTLRKIQSIFISHWDLPAPLQIYLLLSVVLPIGILLLNRSALRATLLLPFLAAALYLYPPTPSLSPYPNESSLYPFLAEPLSSSILEQKTQLESALDLYLMDRYQTEDLSMARYLFTIDLFKKEPIENGWNFPILGLFLTVWSLFYVRASFNISKELVWRRT